MNNIVKALTLLLLLNFTSHLSADQTEDLSAILDNIKKLASDDWEGRGIGTKGINKAADFIREEFLKAGLKLPDKTLKGFQNFQMTVGSHLGKTNRLTLISPEGKEFVLSINSDFAVSSLGGSGKIDSELVFCGYGIDDKKKNLQEFENVDVKGKTVIIVRRVPQQDNPKGPFSGVHGSITRHGNLSTKISNAYQKGAIAVIFVNDIHTVKDERKSDIKLKEKIQFKHDKIEKKLKATPSKEEEQLKKLKQELVDLKKELIKVEEEIKQDQYDTLMKFGYAGRAKKNAIPVFQIKQDVCNNVLQKAIKKDIASFAKEMDKELKSQSQLLSGWKIKGIATVVTDQATVKNVIGVIEGDGTYPDETIVIGAHYDHLGFGGTGSLAPMSKDIHNGADDNASGSVALIELAKRIEKRKKKPSRRLVFIAFTAEEKGLIGSAHYVKNPIYPLNKTIAMINMDMVGRLEKEKLTIFGTGTAPRWKPLFEKINQGDPYHFKLTLKPNGFGPSDHSSFYAKKIPVLHFFTGTHADYHRPSDDWDKINVEGIHRITGFIENVLEDTLAQKDVPKYIEIKERAVINRGGRRPYFGSIPDFGTEAKGYAISGVAPGSPAAKGGLKGDDIIIRVGESKIGSLEDFDLVLRKFAPGDDIDVTVKRAGKEVKLKVTLTKRR